MENIKNIYTLPIEDLNYILINTKDLWVNAYKANFFITGGTGFFGIWMLESFLWINERLNLNAQATILTRNYEAFKQKHPHLINALSLKYVTGDIRSFVYPKEKFDFIIHGASASAESKFLCEDPEERLSIILDGTRNILRFAAYNNTKSFLYISSGAVYGKQPPSISSLDEQYNGSPNINEANAEVGIGKKVSEFLCTVYSKKHNMDIKIARCFTFIGPYLQLNLHYAVGNFIRDALMGGPIIVKSDGSAVRSYMYASELIVWLWTILFKGKNCDPYNVGSEEPITIKDLAFKVAEIYKELTGKSVDVIVQGKASPEKRVDRYIPSTKKAQTELGLKQTLTLEEAIKKTFLFYLSAQKNFYTNL
ncbi:NAD-dependent epimerase/dehydratase family protein [Thermodesulfobacterium sp. TA1]|uniref:NAD-dependent epimerase/dehydratase family protein n=1 Tax=Thermodesulfobacterium sp. TA1 TaxID=2234087 RepID=UPI00123297AC|nr:NAD-dependent epimerase/dehydratase family protein [Thermodesulfobacterium sp. TA1]QER42862.1 NAD-dependent epimerase/dehydratase family protein [Thermodesulfobacterium sp. TA1]